MRPGRTVPPTAPTPYRPRPTAGSAPRPRAGAVLTAALTLVLALAGCSSPPEDPLDQQRERLEQLGVSLGIPAGFPGPASTGVPLGTKLEKSGSVTVSEDGTVLENLDIEGCVKIRADDVTIRNSRIRCADNQRVIAIDGERKNIVVEDSEIDGRGSTQIAIGWAGYTLRRVDVHDVLDGPRLGSDVVVEDSWIHDIVRQGKLHPDTMQSTGGTGIVVRRNTLVVTDRVTGDLMNSAIQLGAENDSGVLRDVLIEDNYLDGGNYTVNIRTDDGIEDVVVRDNVFGGHARYGQIIAGESVTIEGNSLARPGTTGSTGSTGSTGFPGPTSSTEPDATSITVERKPD